MEDTNFLVYALVSTVNKKKTYVGMTNNPVRRLRQHNGSLKGGARFTRGGRPWRFIFHVTGLKKSEALRLEWAMKKKRVSGVSGPLGRIKTLQRLMTLERWTLKSPKVKDIQHRIKIKYF